MNDDVLGMPAFLLFSLMHVEFTKAKCSWSLQICLLSEKHYATSYCDFSWVHQ